MQGWIQEVALLVVVGAGCVASELKDGGVGSRENERVVSVIGSYFSGYGTTTNFIDMSKQDKLSTIQSLRRNVGVGIVLVFFEVTDSGQFIQIDSTEAVDAQLTSCGLTRDEIVRVEDKVRAKVGHHQMPQGWAGAPKASEKGKWGSSGHARVLTSSRYNVSYTAHYTYDNTATQAVYKAACCLILSPTSQR